MTKNKLEQQIIRLYDSNVVNLFSINQISKSLKKKYPYINKKISMMLDEGIMNKIVVGRSHLCSLNLDNPRTILLLADNEIAKRKPKDFEDVLDFVQANQLQLSIISVVHFNSKIIFVVDSLKDRRAIQRRFPDADVIDKVGLLDMVSENKELFEHHRVVYGYENFFSLLRLETDELKRKYSPLRY